MRKLCIVLFSLILVGQGCLISRTVSTADGGVFKTTDGGDQWQQATAIPGPRGVGSIAIANVISIDMDPQDNDVIYLGTRENGLLFTLDAAASWQQPRDEALKQGAITAVAVDPKDVCTVYVAKADRLYKSEDCLRTFDDEAYVETRVGVYVIEVAVDWFNTSIIWLGLSNGDLLKSEDGGATWRTAVSTGEYINEILVSASDSRKILLALAEGGIDRTTDGGETWARVNEQLKPFDEGDKVAAIIQDAAGQTVVAATRYGLLRSPDFGSTWEAVGMLTAPRQVDVRAVAMDPNNTDTLYYAVDGTFYRSIDGGEKWTTQKVETTRRPEVLMIDPSDSKTLYLGVVSVE